MASTTDYYQRDLSHLDVNKVEPRVHFCGMCGVHKEPTDYVREHYSDEGWWEPTLFTCPGYDGKCHCLHIKKKEGNRWVQSYFCSLACASKAKACGKKVWYTDEKGKWVVW